MQTSMETAQQLVLDGWLPPTVAAPKPEPHDLDALLRAVLEEARQIGIPLSDNIFPHVAINRRAKTRFGCCRKVGDNYLIELSHLLLYAPMASCKQVLAHEVLHTCYGCRNHGARWRAYSRRMSNAYEYDISRVDSHENLGIEDKPKAKYTVTCQNCGNTFERIRASKLTMHPDLFRCRCGGKLKVCAQE